MGTINYKDFCKQYDPTSSMSFSKVFMPSVIRCTFLPSIRKVIFNNPATIVFWDDGSKTVVKCSNEVYDPEKGLAMAISKKVLGNQGRYYETFKKWVPESKPLEE